MELSSATDIQFSNLPAVQVWKGASLVWNRGLYWSGLGSDNNWSTDNNWSGLASPVNLSPIQFAGTNRLSAFNDLPVDTTFESITFGSNSGSFQLSGNGFIIGSSGIKSNSLNNQTINNDVKLSTGTNIISTNDGNITFNGLLSGNGSLHKTGSGQINVSVARSIFTGSVTVSGGTLQFDNLTTNGGGDLKDITPSVFNLNNNGATLIFNADAGRVRSRIKTYNFSSLGNQTINYMGTCFNNDSTFITNGGPKNYITGSILEGQFTTVFYNVADGTDDVDLEISATLNRQSPTKTGNGKLSIVNSITNITGPITISNGTFDIGGICSLPNLTNTIDNNATFSYSSSNNSNCSLYSINGTGNLIKSGTSSLTLSSARCTYNGYTSITNGSIVATRNTATATFTPTTLTVNFTTPPSIGNTFRFFSGSTVQSYPSVSLIGATGRTASYNSSNSTLTIDS
jgi:autotransporter-associated beta strand protein